MEMLEEKTLPQAAETGKCEDDDGGLMSKRTILSAASLAAGLNRPLIISRFRRFGLLL